MARRQHTHRFDPRVAMRGRRRCKLCGVMQYSVGRDADSHLMWRDSMPIRRFAEKWLPVVSGTKPESMLHVSVAYPFEWNCYETWQVVLRVHFDFTDVVGRVSAGLGTLTDVMNGWRSEWQEDFCRIDRDAEQYYTQRTGKPYSIGDNTYAEMRRIIQS